MKPFRLLRRTITWAGLGIAGGAVLVTARHLLSTPQPLESTLTGEGRIDRRREGQIYYNVSGPEAAEPLVLLHDFYPGASNYEMRRIFPRLAPDYRVYAPDWLGFGMSERPALAYTGELYADVLTRFLRETVQRPAVVIAHGLASNVAVRAASDEPALFERLVLVAPHTQAGMEPGPTVPQVLVRLAQRTSLGLVPYAALATRPAVRWQVSRRAARPGEGGATDDAVDHIYASAHQFGGHHALLALLTGELDLPVHNAFALLEPPVLVVGGERDTLHPRAQLEDLALLNPYAQIVTVPGAADAVFEDAPAAFVERVGLWLGTPRQRHVSPLLERTHPAVERREAAAPQAQAAPTGNAAQEAGKTVAPVDEATMPGEATVSGGIFAASARDVEPEARAEGAPLAAEIDTGAPEVDAQTQTEQFGEPRGMVTPVPGLENLEGLQQSAPEVAPAAESEELPEPPRGADFAPLDVAGNVADAGAAPVPETRVVGKPEGEVDETTGTPAEAQPPRGDVRAEAAPPRLERELEAPVQDADWVVVVVPPEPEAAAQPSTPAGEAQEQTAAGADEMPEQPERLGDARAEAAATLQTAELLADLEERAGLEAQRVDEAIREEAPGTVTDSATTDADAEAPGTVMEGVASEAEAEAKGTAATGSGSAAMGAQAAPTTPMRGRRVEKPDRPSQALRSEGRQAPARTPRTPESESQAPGRMGGAATGQRASGKATKGAHSGQHARSGTDGQKPQSRKGKRGHK